MGKNVKLTWGTYKLLSSMVQRAMEQLENQEKEDSQEYTELEKAQEEIDKLQD